jgi:hypothetical protein
MAVLADSLIYISLEVERTSRKLFIKVMPLMSHPRINDQRSPPAMCPQVGCCVVAYQRCDKKSVTASLRTDASGPA